MESARRKLKIWKDNLLFFLEKVASNRKWFFQLAVIIFLLIVSLFLYIGISKKSGYKSINSYKSKMINDGINQYRLENYPRAEMIFNRIIERSRDKNELSIAFLYLGNIMMKRNRYSKALMYYKNVYANKSIGKYAFYNSAVAELKEGNVNRAINNIRYALKYDKTFVAADLLLGNLYYLDEEYRKAIKIYDKYPYNPIFLYNKAVTYLALKNTKAAEEIFSSLIVMKNTEKVIKGLSYFNLGNIYNMISPKKSALYYSHAYKFFNQNNDLLYNTAIMMSKSGDYDMAGKLLLETDFSKVSDKEKIAYGYILFRSDNYKKALSLLSTVKNNLSDAYIVLGEINLEKGNISNSEKYFIRALQSAGNDIGKLIAYNQLISLYRKSGMINKAVNLCNSMDEKAKSNFLILLSCAEIAFENGKKEKGLVLMSKALDKSNNDRDKLFQLSVIYYKYGFSNNALKILYKIRDLYPDDYRALLGITKIFSEKGQKNQALRGLNLIIKRCKDVDIYYNALILKAKNVNTDEAKKIYKGLIRDFPYRYEAYYNLARLLLLKENYEESIKTVNEMMFNAEKIPVEGKLYGYIVKGIALFKIGKRNEAYRTFLNATSIEKNNEIARINLRLLKKITK